MSVVKDTFSASLWDVGSMNASLTYIGVMERRTASMDKTKKIVVC
jgi:hypothetical protein